MFEERRPTCVTVIGWVWVVIGGLMCFGAIMAVLASLMMRDEMSQHQANEAIMLRILPVLALVQIVVGLLGLVSGVNFLKLRAWSRPVLEVLSWLLLVYVVGFGIFCVFKWVSMTWGQGRQGLDIMGAVMGIVIMGAYGVPVGIMVVYLRGAKVKNAISVIREHRAGGDAGQASTSQE